MILLRWLFRLKTRSNSLSALGLISHSPGINALCPIVLVLNRADFGYVETNSSTELIDD
jgi:hypothetical protein